MSWPDLLNGLFELFGGCMIWLDVRRLAIDKQIKGVYWPSRAFFLTWGVWNLYYYPSLDQWLSFFGGLVICSANIMWCVLAVWYLYLKPR